jgi:hypothetical protein
VVAEGGSAGPRQVSLRTPFERFPATVKGAFVFRGEDPDPHQVRLLAVRLVRLPTSEEIRTLPMDPVIMTVPPRSDVFVPFETSVSDLEPGWYGFEVDVEVDGSPRTMGGDRRFPSPWPRGTMRSGTVRVDRHVAAGPHTVRVDRVLCSPDVVQVRFSVHPPAGVELRAEAGGAPVEVLEVKVDPATGEGTAVAYPIPRGEGSLRLVFRVPGPTGGDAQLTIGLG